MNYPNFPVLKFPPRNPKTGYFSPKPKPGKITPQNPRGVFGPLFGDVLTPRGFFWGPPVIYIPIYLMFPPPSFLGPWFFSGLGAGAPGAVVGGGGGKTPGPRLRWQLAQTAALVAGLGGPLFPPAPSPHPRPPRPPRPSSAPPPRPQTGFPPKLERSTGERGLEPRKQRFGC